MKEEQPNEIAEDSEPGVTHALAMEANAPIPQGSQSLPSEGSALATAVGSEAGQSMLNRKAGGPRTTEGKRRSKRNSLKYGVFSDIVLLKGESRVKYNLLWNGLREAYQPVGLVEQMYVEDMAINRWHRRRQIKAEVAEIRKATEFLQWEQRTREREEVDQIGKIGKVDLATLLEDQHGLLFGTDNPLVLQRCLDLLAELREQFEKNGFTEKDIRILGKIYGNAYVTNLGDNLYKAYELWRERMAEGYASPAQCKSNVLQAIDREIRRLKRHRKSLATIETQRTEIEALRLLVPESPALDRLLRHGAGLDRSFDRMLSQLERLQRMRLGQPVLPELKVRHSLS